MSRRYPEADNGQVETLRLLVDPPAVLSADGPAAPANATLALAGAILRDGGTVAFATETVYGLGANALDATAIEKIFAAKQRPAWDPLIVHIADVSMLTQVVGNIPPAARILMDHFWPGPLTLLMPRHADLPATVTAGRGKVGVRMPAHPVARALICAAGVPIAAPSANTFGHVSPTTAAHVAADLDGRIDAILDSGETTLGLESTVLDTCVDPCILYRPGAITLEQLRAVWPSVAAYADPEVELDTGDAALLSGLPSPGLGMRHYAPRARLVLVESDSARLAEHLLAALHQARADDQRTGLMLPREFDPQLRIESEVTYAWGAWNDPVELAQRLFAGLRALDAQCVDVIVCPVPPAEGIGAAIIDRLRKAARRR
jgi:L-threonylcarbamoyladenylate synthase